MKTDRTALGDRMKLLERCSPSSGSFIPRVPLILRMYRSRKI